ncbi:MAG: TRAP transporter small permease subunit [Desulfobacula sp.]|uniref:TRAP transporter small permease n=1 Tax=Desulfobacula sp. TaxID=2593537 RepID=UPI0025BB13D6|nr:TRAP transporter small permease subunit [Desulfobacula sp.]MCD4722815.1 TRAP transporter small permease subunit [Desulfobacula sp.]
MDTLDKISLALNRILTLIGGVFLVGMVVLTCSNIFCRIVWVPVRGTFELMGYFGAIVTAFALGYTQIKRGHIAVDVLINTFSPRKKRVLHIINASICFVFFALAAWQIAVKATTLMTTGEVTETLRIIYYPFTYAVSFGCLVLSLVLLSELVKLFFYKKEAKR